MRAIKFRGKRVDNGEWVYGYYVYTHEKHRIIYEDILGFYCEHEIQPETIGQFIGKADRNGKEFYEGDIYQRHDNTYLVIWREDCFLWQQIWDSWLKKNVFNREQRSYMSSVDCKNFNVIIGNRHDNPELLK